MLTRITATPDVFKKTRLGKSRAEILVKDGAEWIVLSHASFKKMQHAFRQPLTRATEQITVTLDVVPSSSFTGAPKGWVTLATMAFHGKPRKPTVLHV